MHRDLFRPRHILAVKTRHLHSKMGGCIQAMPECFLQIPDAFRQWPGCIAGQISRMHSGHGLYAPGDGSRAGRNPYLLIIITDALLCSVLLLRLRACIPSPGVFRQWPECIAGQINSKCLNVKGVHSGQGLNASGFIQAKAHFGGQNQTFT